VGNDRGATVAGLTRRSDIPREGKYGQRSHLAQKKLSIALRAEPLVFGCSLPPETRRLPQRFGVAARAAKARAAK